MKKITLCEVLKLSIELETTKRQPLETVKEKVKELRALENKFVNATIKTYQQYE